MSEYFGKYSYIYFDSETWPIQQKTSGSNRLGTMKISSCQREFQPSRVIGLGTKYPIGIPTFVSVSKGKSAIRHSSR